MADMTPSEFKKSPHADAALRAHLARVADAVVYIDTPAPCRGVTIPLAQGKANG